MLSPAMLAALAVAFTGVAAGPISTDLISAGVVERDDVLAGDDGYLETVVFKRDSILTPDDHELAKKHNIDVSQSMYTCPPPSSHRHQLTQFTCPVWKHSVMKRADGNDYTLWVSNHFTERDDSVGDFDGDEDDVTKIDASDEEGQYPNELMKRQQRVKTYLDGVRSGSSGQCGHSTFGGDTGPNAPFTGGIVHMSSWARNAGGYFLVPRVFSYASPNPYRPLVVAGSNNGFNAVFEVRLHYDDKVLDTRVGTADIADIARDVDRKFKKNIGGWRARGKGGMRCGHWRQQILNRTWVNWRLTNWKGNI